LVMSKRLKFVISIAIIIVLACADLLLTYIASPDLAWEANPLVYTFNHGWTALILSNIIFITISTVLCYIAHFRYERKKIIHCTSFCEFYSILFFERKGISLISLRIPKNIIAVATYLNYILLRGVSLMRIFAIYMWSEYLRLWGVGLQYFPISHRDHSPLAELILRSNDAIHSIFPSTYFYPVAIVIPVLITTILSSLYWIFKEFKIYNRLGLLE